MRNVVLHMKMSVDGYIGDAEGGVDWVFPTVDEEVTDWILELLRNAGTHIMGHTLYDEMAAYWPHSAEPFATPMNEMPKVVFSGSLEEATWDNTTVARGDIEREIQQLKLAEGNYILAHGGSRFAQSLDRHGLVDEYRLLVHPISLGGGLPLFAAHRELKQVGCRTFKTGVVALTYRPA